MSGNLDNDRSIATNKMFPMDLAPQKITIVKSVSNSEVKMAHLISGQPKASGSSQLGTHGGSASALMRPSLTQIIAPNSSSQPQMILSSSPILQATQIVSQGSQLHSQGTQVISQSQILTPGGQLLSPGTQIISQGTQLSAPTSNSNITSSSIGAPVLNVGGQLASGASNLVVNSSVRTLQSTVRVLPTLPHHNNRSATVLTSVNVSGANNMVVSKGVNVGVTSHVPRGLAAGASLALRPVTPSSIQPTSNQNISGNSWGGVSSGGARAGRGALVYGSRARAAHQPHCAAGTLPTSTVLNSASGGVISGAVRGVPPRAAPSPAAPRALPLLQRNYQPAKYNTQVVGVSPVGIRGVGNSAPTQLYYEVPRAATPTHAQTHNPNHAPNLAPNHAPNIVSNHASSHASNHAPNHASNHAPSHAPIHAQTHTPRPLTPYSHSTQTHHLPAQVNIVNASVNSLESRSTVSIQTAPALAARPTILRKRDVDGSPSKPASVTYPAEGSGWEDVARGSGGSGGSTTMSASSSPPRDDDHAAHRKKPRKQLLSNDVRHCEFPAEEPPPSPPPVTINPPPKRPQLGSSYVCGWRGTAMHFVRAGDVRRRDVRPRDILAIAAQKHVLASADGWKVHHLTAQMDDLMTLESDVGTQLAGLLRALETASGKALSALQPHSHTLLELFKGNIQRSKIVCEGIQEAREDILRVFTHRKSVSDILTRQADKRCFRKHRSQS